MLPRTLPYLPAAILFAGCALLWDAHSQASVPLGLSLRSALPAVPGYDVADQRITADEARIAGMTDYVARSYRRDGAVAFTTFVSYYDRQTQGRTIHSPRNCLPGAGWEIMSGGTQVVTIDGTPRTVNRYVLKNGTATAIAYYWYQGRGRITANEYQVKWNLLRDAALAGRTEEALVRVVVPIHAGSATSGIAGNIAKADATASRISAALISELGRILPERGSRGA
jgi:EpsI family protein